MGLCLLWQPAIFLYIIVMYYVVLVWRNKFSSSSSSSRNICAVNSAADIIRTFVVPERRTAKL